jgi:S1-C subfamily serine protease
MLRRALGSELRRESAVASWGRAIWILLLSALLPRPLLGQGFQPPGGTSFSGNQAATRERREIGSSAVESVTERIRRELAKSEPRASRAAPSAAPAEKATAADDEREAAATKATGKSVTPPPPSGKGRVKTVETDAQQCREAEEALLLYRIFMADAETTAEEKEQAQPRLEFWEQAARDDLIRVGTKWMSRPDAVKLKEEADKLVAEAIELIAIESFKKADEKLERASRIYPDHLESLFLLGLGALLTNDAKGAEKRFSQCLARAPGNVPLLNNAAICSALSKKYDRAVKYWEKAASIEPENPVIAQNLGQFISDATKGKSITKAARAMSAASVARGRSQERIQIDFSTVDRHVIDDASELYAKLVAGGKVPRANPTGSYLIMKLFRPKKGDKSDKSEPEDSQIVGNGSGFVIWEGFVLTNRHVVDKADAVVIQDPGNSGGEPLPGKVVAVSREMDLALIQCGALLAPPAPVSSAAVGRGTEVLALGFPVMSVVGKGLKATRGIVTGLPSNDTGNLMVLDVQVNPGNSGGPLCDKSGRVMGVVAAKTFTERFVQGYGLAIPMSDAVKFIKRNIPAFTEPEPTDRKLEWTEVDAQLSKSTVLVLIKKKKKPT